MLAIEGLSTLELGEPRYPLRVINGLQEVKDDFTFSIGRVVFDENDLYSGNQPDFKFKKLDARNEAVTDFAKDLSVLADLRGKVQLIQFEKILIQLLVLYLQIFSKMHLDAVWINMKGLEKIVGEYGLESKETTEAIKLLKGAIDQLEDSLQTVYAGKVLRMEE